MTSSAPACCRVPAQAQCAHPFAATGLGRRSPIAPLRRIRRELVVRGQTSSTQSTDAFTLFTLPDGVKLELISHERVGKTDGKAPLVFVHGSGHAAWCWQEHFLPFFAEAGRDCYALSARGQGRGDRPAGLRNGGTLAGHAADLAAFVASLERSPVLVGHSFGGVVVQRYIVGPKDGDPEEEAFPRVAGAALLCAAPPTGNSDMVRRLVRKSWPLALRLTWGMVTRSFLRSRSAARELFFSADLPEERLMHYAQRLAETASPIRVIDVEAFNREVPLARPRPGGPPVFVLGGADDIIVDAEGVAETAAWYGVKPIVLPGMAHDCMLDTRWEEAAHALLQWLEALD